MSILSFCLSSILPSLLLSLRLSSPFLTSISVFSPPSSSSFSSSPSSICSFSRLSPPIRSFLRDVSLYSDLRLQPIFFARRGRAPPGRAPYRSHFRNFSVSDPVYLFSYLVPAGLSQLVLFSGLSARRNDLPVCRCILFSLLSLCISLLYSLLSPLHRLSSFPLSLCPLLFPSCSVVFYVCFVLALSLALLHLPLHDFLLPYLAASSSFPVYVVCLPIYLLRFSLLLLHPHFHHFLLLLPAILFSSPSRAFQAVGQYQRCLAACGRSDAAASGVLAQAGSVAAAD